jgi:CheY-like chemotaxis protein
MTSDEPDLRTLLIRAALEILEEPETPLDLRKVAERAGKSRTAPYLVFGKEREGGGVVALRLAVAAEGARMLRRELDAVDDPDGNPLDAFHDLATAFFQFATTHGRLYRLMFGPEIGVAATLRGLAHWNHPELERLVHERMALEARVQGIVERCQEARLLPEGESIRPTMIAWANLQGIALLLLDEVLELADVWTTTAEAADLATEALVGTPRSVLEGATLCLLQAQELRGQELRAPAAVADESEVAWTLDGLVPMMEESTEAQSPGVYWALDEMAAAAPPEPDVLAARDLILSESSAAKGAIPLGRASRPSSEPDLPLPRDATSHPALRRALAARTALQGARVLWIDDHPEWVEWEKRMLERLEVDVTTATDTGRALKRLHAAPYDLILSDIARGSRGDEGVAALPALRSQAPDTPVIFYVADLEEGREPPAGSAGITNRPDELLHLVLDVLERRRS